MVEAVLGRLKTSSSRSFLWNDGLLHRGLPRLVLVFLRIMVLKPGSDCMVGPEKPRTTHFCGSFSLKNNSMLKKQGPLRTVVGPHGFENRDQTASYGSLLPFESKP